MRRTIRAPATTASSATSSSAANGTPVIGRFGGGPDTPGWVTPGGSDPGWPIVKVTLTCPGDPLTPVAPD